MSLISQRTWRLAEIEKFIRDRQAIEAEWKSQERACPDAVRSATACPGLDEEHVKATAVMAELLAALDSADVDETISDPSPKLVLEALGRIHRDLKIVSQAVAERVVNKAPAENAGLPCPYCQEKLPRMDLKRLFVNGEEVVDVRVSCRANKKELLAITRFLKTFRND